MQSLLSNKTLQLLHSRWLQRVFHRGILILSLAQYECFYGNLDAFVKHNAMVPLFGMSLVEDDDCRAAASRLVCATAFQECTLHPISFALPAFLGKCSHICSKAILDHTAFFLVLPLPSSPCKQLCFDAQVFLVTSLMNVWLTYAHKSKCAPYGIPLPNCSDINSFTGLPDYPPIKNIYVINNSDFPVQCNNVTEQPARNSKFVKQTTTVFPFVLTQSLIQSTPLLVHHLSS